jgi:predicted membrane protein
MDDTVFYFRNIMFRGEIARGYIRRSERRDRMGLALTLIVMGMLILLDRMGSGYGLREGWPWVVIALGIGTLFRNSRSVAGWVTTVVGILILGSRYYSIHLSIPTFVKTYFLPVLLIVIGFLWLLKYRKD